jgi:hypothetical protein
MECDVPEVCQTSEKHKTQAITIGEFGLFHLTIEDNHLLTQNGVFNYQVSFTSGQV